MSIGLGLVGLGLGLGLTLGFGFGLGLESDTFLVLFSVFLSSSLSGRPPPFSISLLLFLSFFAFFLATLLPRSCFDLAYAGHSFTTMQQLPDVMMPTDSSSALSSKNVFLK